MGQYMEEVGGPAGGVEPGETGDVHADGSWGVVGKEDGVWGVGESQQGGKEVSRPYKLFHASILVLDPLRARD